MQYRSSYTEQIILREDDTDYRGLMKPSALLRYAEQAATAHSEALGRGDGFYQERQLVYLLGKQALQFFAVPHKRAVLTAVTIPEKNRRGANKRITLFYDPSGKEVARVDARWILVDTASGKIVRRLPEGLDDSWNDEVECELPQLVHKPAQLAPAGTARAAYSLCDVNRHINNAAYLDIACDALPLEVMEQGPVVYAAVKYHRQVLLGQQMELCCGQTADEAGPGWYIAGRREGRTSFELFFRW